MERNSQTDQESNTNSNTELSYEEEQLQQILIEESEKIKIKMDRELREIQEIEYKESLKKDLQKNIEFYEPSQEEMRAVRLKRFEKG